MCVFRCMWILTVMYSGMTILYVCIQVYVYTNSVILYSGMTILYVCI